MNENIDKNLKKKLAKIDRLVEANKTLIPSKVTEPSEDYLKNIDDVLTLLDECFVMKNSTNLLSDQEWSLLREKKEDLLIERGMYFTDKKLQDKLNSLLSVLEECLTLNIVAQLLSGTDYNDFWNKLYELDGFLKEFRNEGII